MKEKIYLYTGFERFWHWTQAMLITGLLVTGFEIHGTVDLMDFGTAVKYHEMLAWGLTGLTVFAIFWHFTTGEWKQYRPTLEKMGDMVCYYTGGLFRGAPPPVKKTPEKKLNPLQRITYFILKVLLFPFQLLSGFLYMYYNSLPAWGIDISLETLGLLHTAGAFAFLAFMVVHVYLSTTGETVTSHLRAMITGWESVETGRQ
ncbi:MAG TPA: cytochrome b/b6 domain-containing protein [Thermodesulfobacteriaceae bacterium]|nr:cytochrome b/b6 domain-containing protein [Thermodesulfobacteriaceae bacterium]